MKELCNMRMADMQKIGTCSTSESVYKGLTETLI